MARWCVDASAVLAALLRESATSVARAFWDDLTTSDEIIAPQVLFPECTSVLRRRASEGVISVNEGRALIDEMLRMPIRVQDPKEQFRIAFDWASRMRRIKTHD